MKRGPYIKVKGLQNTKNAKISRRGTGAEVIALLCVAIECISSDVNMTPSELARTIAGLIGTENKSRKE